MKLTNKEIESLKQLPSSFTKDNYLKLQKKAELPNFSRFTKENCVKNVEEFYKPVNLEEVVKILNKAGYEYKLVEGEICELSTKVVYQIKNTNATVEHDFEKYIGMWLDDITSDLYLNNIKFVVNTEYNIIKSVETLGDTKCLLLFQNGRCSGVNEDDAFIKIRR